MATRISILSRSDECLSLLQPLSAYFCNWSLSIHQMKELTIARMPRTIANTLRPAPSTYKKHQRTPKKAAARAENRRIWSPLKNIQYRTRPSSRLISSSWDWSLRSSSRSAKGLLQTLALGVEDFEFAEEGALGFDLRA